MIKPWFFLILHFKTTALFFKPIFDRTVALIGLLVLWPLLLVIALLVKAKIGSPVFFVQERIGKDGKPFRMYKFRTMKEDENMSPVTMAGESRITPLGAKLRKYKLDELPELWNVLKGDMSFVGPRPDVPGYADRLQGDDREVLLLRPGITGPASLKYRNEEEMIAEYVAQAKTQGDSRSEQEIALWYNDNVIWPDKVRINRYYLHHYSFGMDLKMILATVLGRHILYNGETI